MTDKLDIAELERLRSLLEYDPQTGVFRFRRTCGNRVAGRVVGSTNSDGYARTMSNGKYYILHRVAWLFHYGRWPVGQIDHINGNRLDNRIANLREVDHVGNGRNRKRQANNKSGVTGVRWRGDWRKWNAQIRVGGRQMHLGSFETMDAAVAARRSAERALGFHENHGRRGE